MDQRKFVWDRFASKSKGEREARAEPDFCRNSTEKSRPWREDGWGHDGVNLSEQARKSTQCAAYATIVETVRHGGKQNADSVIDERLVGERFDFIGNSGHAIQVLDDGVDCGTQMVWQSRTCLFERCKKQPLSRSRRAASLIAWQGRDRCGKTLKCVVCCDERKHHTPQRGGVRYPMEIRCFYDATGELRDRVELLSKRVET